MHDRIPQASSTAFFARIFVWSLLALASATVASATEPLEQYNAAVQNGSILMARYPAASPDGRQIAFAYRGDLWVVAREGGAARRLTAAPGRELYPVWSPEGGRIAFASTQNGNADVYTVSLTGGPPQRLTYGSWSDWPTSWTPDGGAVLFESRRHIGDGRNGEIYLVRYEGGNPVRVLPGGGDGAVLSSDGLSLAFERGATSWWRTGYEGPGKDRLWLFDMEEPLTGGLAARQMPALDPVEDSQSLIGELAHLSLRPTGTYTPLTALGSDEGVRRSFERDRSQAPEFGQVEQEFGANASPQWFPGGSHILYISESHGISNLKVLDVRSGHRAWVTRFEDGRLRNPTLSRDGSVASFEYNDGISTVAIPPVLPTPDAPNWLEEPGTPERLHIQIPFDLQQPAIERYAVSGGANEMALSPDDEQIAFVREGDLFAMKASEDESYAYPLTESPSREQDVNWSSDSKSIVYVSDASGSQSIYRMASADESEERLAKALRRDVTQLTKSKEDDAHPLPSPDGEKIAFVRGTGTLMVMSADGSGQKVLVDSWSEPDFRWSPDSKWLVFSQDDNDFNTDIFVVPVDGSKDPFNISRHPDDDRAPYWSADGKVIAFVSSRRFPSETDVWYVRLTHEDDELSKEDRLDAKEDKSSKKDKDKDKKKDKDKGDDDDGDDDDGDDDSDDGKDDVPEVRIDFDGIHERTTRLTSFPGRDTFVLVSKDGKEFVFSTDTDGERDLWKIKWDGSDEERLTKGGTNPRSVQWDKSGKNLFYRHGDGRFASIGSGGGSKTSYSYKAQVRVDRPQQRAAVLREVWRELGARFYDEDMHGANWSKMLDQYSPWAAAASTYADYNDVVKMMLGEIRGSHLNFYGGPSGYDRERNGDVMVSRRDGIEDDQEFAAQEAIDFTDSEVASWGQSVVSRFSASTGDAGGISARMARRAGTIRTANENGSSAQDADGSPLRGASGELGVFIDPRHSGEGQRVAFVVPGSPADHVESRLEVGDIILSVDGRPIDSATNIYKELERTVSQRVVLRVKKGKTESDVVIRPIATRSMRGLLYDYKVDVRQKRVDELSGGRVAYVHIRSMGVPSLEDFERDLYAQAHGRDALIIDVRDNGGGWTTDLMMTSINAADHAFTIPRGGGNGYPEDRRLIYAWNRPIVTMCNENSFSNAEIFSWAIQTTQRGPVVGMQTYGGVISTGGMYVGDGHWLRLPFRGWYTKLDGSDMDEVGCTPDVVVANTPQSLADGVDDQLAKAVEAALEQLR